MDLIQKIILSTPNYSTDDIAREFDVYFKSNKYIKYDSAAIPEETYLLSEYLLDNCGYIDLDGHHQYTKHPGAIVIETANNKFALPDVNKVFALMYSNLSVWLLIGRMQIRLITFIDKDYLVLKEDIPKPEELIEYRLTSKYDFYEPSKDSYLDEHLG